MKNSYYGYTPNVVIRNPNIRFWVTGIVFALSLMSAIAALMFSFFPELAQGTDIPSRVIGLSNAVISVLSAAFGLGVSLRNVPYIATNVERVRGTIPPHGNVQAFQADVGELRERLIDGK